MPGSSTAGRREALDMVLTLDPATILDVGPGWGIWVDLLRPWFAEAEFDCIEIYEPYVDRYHLDVRYDLVMVGDVRDLAKPDFIDYDLVIFGDVLEHMDKVDAVAVVAKLLTRWALVSIPLGPMPQEGTDNPYEEHLSTWTVEDVLSVFPVRYPYYAEVDRGVFLLEKKIP